jgi:hypothetical protein
MVTYAHVHVRFGSKADIERRNLDVRFTPNNGHQLSALECPLSANSGHSALRQRLALFDHLVGAGLQGLRHSQTQRFCGFQIDDELVFGWCLNWKIDCLLTS